MVALELQKDLVEELTRIFENKLFKTPKGKQSKLNIFKQNLPMRSLHQTQTETMLQEREFDEEMLDEETFDEETLDEELDEQFPYCIVKIDSGKSEEQKLNHIISTKLIFGIYDDSLEATGYMDILNLFEDIRYRFRTNPVLNKRYIIEDEISWALPDEDEETFPFFFGALFLNWKTAEYRREDDLA